MVMLKKLKNLTAKEVLKKKECSFIKGGMWVDQQKGKGHGYPPPFDEQ